MNSFCCLWFPAQFDISIGGDCGFVVTVTLPVAGTILSGGPIWLLSVDRHLREGYVGGRRHQHALVVDVDVFVNQHSVVVLSVSCLFECNVEGAVLSRINVAPGNCPHFSVRTLRHEAGELIPGFARDARGSHDGVLWIIAVNKP